MATLSNRLDRLNDGLLESPIGCHVCGDWPALRVVIGENPRLSPCPHCGRQPDDGCQIFAIGARSDGPQ
jgi:hypothetical protein